VLAVEVGGLDEGDEELRAVGVGASVSHRQQVGLVVALFEVLVRELVSVDRPSTGAVATGEVTTLRHELRDDTVELGAGVAEALLAGAQSTEVLGGRGDDLVVELERDATPVLDFSLGVGVRDVEVNLDRFDHCDCGGWGFAGNWVLMGKMRMNGCWGRRERRVEGGQKKGKGTNDLGKENDEKQYF